MSLPMDPMDRLIGGVFSSRGGFMDTIIADRDSSFARYCTSFPFVEDIDRFRPEQDSRYSFASERNKRRTDKPTESTRTHYLLDDKDLAHTIIPWEQTHYPTQDLIRTFGPIVEIRPSLVTFSGSQSLPSQQPSFCSWLDYPSKIESKDTFIYLGCNEHTAAAIFQAWEKLGNEYAEKVNYRKQNKILKLMSEFALVVIKYENIFNKNISRPLGLTTEEVCKSYDPFSGKSFLNGDCPLTGESFSQVVGRYQAQRRADAAQRKLVELKASELEGVHHASILRVLKARLGAGTPEFEEGRRYYLADGLPSAGEWTINLAAEEAYLKVFSRIRPHRYLDTFTKMESDDQKASTSRPASDTGINLFWPAEYKGGREEHDHWEDKQSHTSTFDDNEPETRETV